MPGLPGSRAGQGARVVEGVFTEQALGAQVIERDQTRDHRLRRRGLRVGDGVLEGHAACPGVNRNIRHPEPFDAALITEGEIDAVRRRSGSPPGARSGCRHRLPRCTGRCLQAEGRILGSASPPLPHAEGTCRSQPSAGSPRAPGYARLRPARSPRGGAPRIRRTRTDGVRRRPLRSCASAASQ